METKEIEMEMVIDEALKKSRERTHYARKRLLDYILLKKKLEVELSKLNVQCDQWKKAAEAAASMLSDSGGNTNNNCKAKYVENTMELVLTKTLKKLKSDQMFEYHAAMSLS